MSNRKISLKNFKNIEFSVWGESDSETVQLEITLETSGEDRKDTLGTSGEDVSTINLSNDCESLRRIFQFGQQISQQQKDKLNLHSKRVKKT
jgi:hypothetical protein